MDKKNLTIAIHGAEQSEGGVYNVLNSFSTGLLKGFKAIGVSAFSTRECIEKNINFNMSIGFNRNEINIWQKILSNNITNIMWTVDSAFGQNIDVIEQFSSFEKFVLFEVTPADIQAVNLYLPTLKHGYIPHATDTELWQKTGYKKENDIVFFSSVQDYEAIYQQLKETMPPLVYELMMQIREISLNNPQLTFWQICETLKKALGLEFDKEQYKMLFKNISYPLELEQKVKMIQALSDFNVKIYGNDVWKKYITGNIEYVGSCNTSESVEIMEKSKISLHCHPVALGLGLHERILNASAVETFSLVSNSPSINAEFGNAFGYFNHATFEDIAEKAQYYLNNDDERQELAKTAKNIVNQRHTWANRAESIMAITE